MIEENNKQKAVWILNILIVLFSLIGVFIMLLNNSSDGGMLKTDGWKNLKYFTVLSNLFCGIVAAIFMVRRCETGSGMMTLKLMSATCVTLTFLMIALFFGPLYGWINLYKGSNLEFHLIVPVFAMVEFCLLRGKLPFRMAVYSGIPALVYGAFYLGNILIFGKGEWPDTNDWYGFMNWGFGISIVIFGMVVLVSFGIACLLRFVNMRVNHSKL